MPDDPSPMFDEIRSMWRSQTKKPSIVSVEVIRRKTNKLEEAMSLQARIHFAIAVILVVMALYIAWQLDEIFFRLGAGGLILLAVSLVLRARKILPRQRVLDATLNSNIDFYRQELERQIAYLRAGRNTIWPVLLIAAFFFTPFVRGAMGMQGMRGFDARESMYFVVSMAGPFLTMLIVWVGSVFVAVGRKISAVQKEIQELDNFKKEAK